MVPEIWSPADRIFGHFGIFFAVFFTPFVPNNPGNQNFEKMKNVLVEIIILHMCTINENHMMIGFWDMERDR